LETLRVIERPHLLYSVDYRLGGYTYNGIFLYETSGVRLRLCESLNLRLRVSLMSNDYDCISMTMGNGF